jgi:hypothetical protein
MRKRALRVGGAGWQLVAVPLAALLLAGVPLLCSLMDEGEVPTRTSAAEATGRPHPIGILPPPAVSADAR